MSQGGSAARGKRWALIGGGIVLLVLLALAAWWWWQQRGGGADEAQRAKLAALLERQRTLADELAKTQPQNPTDCPPGQALKPISQAPGATPPASSAPPNTAQAPLPTGGEAAALAGPALAQKLEQATAIVIVAGENDLGTGTGFFVAPNQLITNRHVVEKSAGKRIFVTSRALGTLRRASVLVATTSSQPGTPDFALLKLEDGSAAGTLDVASDVTKLAAVVAAGYPGVVLRADASFRRLLQGDLSAAPDLNLTKGEVQSFQTGEGGMPLLVHTASIAKGNSGGPLVDGCGRVVGVNTFISVDQGQSSKLNYAIRSPVMSSFLQAAGATPRTDPRPCSTRG